ncbi:MAG: hypothetical protein K5872_05580 [Rhizobiaceae bacterium]|nr:hypothetical protein [Rhizobiaceae bacterium]MCV0405683.1 hypothetical protein [Rhizobiaceae bacterium]
MAIVSSAVFIAGALAFSGAWGDQPDTADRDVRAGLQVANLSESEAYAEYLRLLSEDARATAALPYLRSERETRTRRLRVNPLLVGVSR